MFTSGLDEYKISLFWTSPCIRFDALELRQGLLFALCMSVGISNFEDFGDVSKILINLNAKMTFSI